MCDISRKRQAVSNKYFRLFRKSKIAFLIFKNTVLENQAKFTAHCTVDELPEDIAVWQNRG